MKRLQEAPSRGTTHTAPKTHQTYRSIHPITMPAVIIAVCFILGIADMIFLRTAMNTLLNLPMSMSSFMALTLATVANFTALLWGKSSGERGEPRSINRYSASSFTLWVAIGLCYMAIRLMNLFTQISAAPAEANISTYIGEVIQMIILAILYIGTGITISAEARNIWDCDESEYRHRKKTFFKQHSALSDDAADLQENIGKLKGYNHNYTALRQQYDKIRTSIHKAESASMADIVGKTLKSHPEVTPSEAHEVMNDMLKRRNG